MKRIGNTNFDIDFCKRFSEEKLRAIYKNESASTLTLLIAEVYPEGTDIEIETTKKKVKVK